MRSKKTVEKWLKRLETPYRAGSIFTNEEEWGMIYALKYVLNYNLSELIKNADSRAMERFKEYERKRKANEKANC